MEVFSDILNATGDKTIPQSSANPHIRRPCFDTNCKQAWKDRKKLNAGHGVNICQKSTPMSKVWNMIQKIEAKGSKSGVRHLKDGDTLWTSKAEIANKLSETLAHHPSSSNYNHQFKRYKGKQEKKPISFNSDNGEDYNETFSLHELQLSHDTAARADNIHYHLLKHLPD